MASAASQLQEKLKDSHFIESRCRRGALIGLIAIMFPEAKIIHCHRNALDTCASCNCRNLPHVGFAHDLTQLGAAYRQYARLMSYWHSVLPGRIVDVQYEGLVNEPEPEIRRLLAHCRLPWHPDCLNPHAKKRPIFTQSATQVRSAINLGSVGRWKNYAKHLGPLINALGLG
jgi:Sulfotransferase family